MNTSRTVTVPDDWRLVLPAGWTTLSTEHARRNEDIKRLLDRQFAGSARDELIQVRVEADRRLRAQVSAAAEAGVTQIHALVEPLNDLPVSATLLVAQLFAGDDEQLSPELRRLLGEAVGVLEVDTVEVGGRPAMRRRRRAEEAIDPTETDSPKLWHTHLDYLVEIDPDRLLVLTFITSTDPLADDLVLLFDAIASSLHTGSVELEWQAVRRAEREQEQTDATP